MYRLSGKSLSVIIVLLLVSTATALAVFVHRNTTDISNALATEVLEQQGDVALLLNHYNALKLALATERLSGPDVSELPVKLALIRLERILERMRSTYTFERLDGAATAHAYVKPIVEDVRQWVTRGIPGVEPNRRNAVSVASQRLIERYPALINIANETTEVANELVNTQTSYLTTFGKYLISLISAFGLLALGIFSLLTRQRDLQSRIVDDQRRHAQRLRDFADTGADWFWEMTPQFNLKILSGDSLSAPVMYGDRQANNRPNQPAPAFDHDVVDDHWPIDWLHSKRAFGNYETELVNRYGELRTVAVSGKPLFDKRGEFTGYRGIGRDITERKQMELELQHANHALIDAEIRGREQAEQALRDSEMFLRTSLNALPEKIAILNHQGVVIEENTAWQAYARLDDNRETPHVNKDHPQHYIDVLRKHAIHEEQAYDSIVSKVDRVLRGDSRFFKTEVQLTKSAPTEWIAIALSAFESNGNRYSVLAIEDISDQKALEAEDRQLRAEVAHASRLTTVGELAAGLAHELNQPLTAISLNCDSLLWGVSEAGSLNSDDLGALEDIHFEAVRAAAIIKGLRKMVRRETGDVAATDINQLVEETMRLSKPDADRHGIDITLQLGESLPSPIIDAVQIQQVLINLERNAIDAIRVDTDKRRKIVISTQCDYDGNMQVSVSNSSSGVSKEVREILFKPFQTTKKNGIGMGLSISRSIVESHGGQLWLDFSDQDMTTFHFILPTVAAEAVGYEPAEFAKAI